MASANAIARIERWALMVGVGTSIVMVGRWSGVADTNMDHVQKALDNNTEEHKTINGKLDKLADEVGDLNGEVKGLSAAIANQRNARDSDRFVPEDRREAQR
ncbi:MAG: hypothetical protein ABSD28_20575 [Tepidisphaeraceae bacterium]|jgi:peptidoglycan hydrolase CwlO-like protein